jgi:Photosystem I psaA/psaB protein
VAQDFVLQMSALHLIYIGWLGNFNSFVHLAALGVHVDGLAILTQLALNLAALGTASSYAAQHINALPAYAYLDKVSHAGLYTHHQYMAGSGRCQATVVVSRSFISSFVADVSWVVIWLPMST